jgi:hypothetical protein
MNLLNSGLFMASVPTNCRRLPIDAADRPQVSEIRSGWIVHGVSLVGGIFSPVFACAACLPVRTRNLSEAARLR